MKTVIFAIDRDNDFGEKLGLKGPIVGRRANLKAAVSMGLHDPEESDTYLEAAIGQPAFVA